MGTRQLFAGNLVNLVVTLLAFLQVIPWPIAGYLIILTALLVTLSYFRSRNQEGTALERRPASLEMGLGAKSSPGEPTSSRKKTVERKVDHESPILEPSISKASKEIDENNESQHGNPRDSPTPIEEGGYLSFDVELEKGEEVVGEVSSTGDVNVYVLTDENLTALDSDQEFWYEAGNEGIRSATVHFTAPEDGEWFFVVENAETKEITATVKVNVGRSPHSVPFLKTESMGLPDARLDARLEGKS